MYDMAKRFAWCIVVFAFGILVGAASIFFLDSGRIQEADRRGAELDRELRAVRADSERIIEAAGRFGEGLQSLGSGLREAQGIAERARGQSEGVAATLKKLIGAFAELEGPIRAMEDDYHRVLSDYNSLRGTLGLAPIQPVTL